MIGIQTGKDSRARSHIAMNDRAAVRRLAKRLKTTEHELRCAVDKVGNSITAVRKQMGLLR
jgi:butyrate kinase